VFRVAGRKHQPTTNGSLHKRVKDALDIKESFLACKRASALPPRMAGYDESCWCTICSLQAADVVVYNLIRLPFGWVCAAHAAFHAVPHCGRRSTGCTRRIAAEPLVVHVAARHADCAVPLQAAVHWLEPDQHAHPSSFGLLSLSTMASAGTHVATNDTGTCLRSQRARNLRHIVCVPLLRDGSACRSCDAVASCLLYAAAGKQPQLTPVRATWSDRLTSDTLTTGTGLLLLPRRAYLDS
jgi:hypothetical protein